MICDHCKHMRKKGCKKKKTPLKHKCQFMERKKWIDFNVEENYIIYSDSPDNKIPIKNGKIFLNMNQMKIEVSFEV